LPKRSRTPSAVVLYKKALRTETSLGVVTTDSAGRFLLRYTGTSGDHGDGPTFGIRLECGTASLTFCNAPANLCVRLVTGGDTYVGRSDFDLDDATLSPLLDTATFDELEIEDVEYLMCRTEIDGETVATLARAHALAASVAVSAEAFYALSRAGLPLSRPYLYSLDQDEVTAALSRAVAMNAVSSSILDDAEDIAETLAEGRVDWMVPATAPESTTLGSLLVAATLGAGKPRAFAEAYAAHTGTTEEFWSTLRTSTEFGTTLVDRIQFTLQVGALTASHAPLVKLLHQMRDAEEFTAAAELAQYDEADWIAFLGEEVDSAPVSAPAGVAGEDETRRRTNYARAITKMIEDQFPSVHLAYRVPSTAISTPPTSFAAFIAQNPDFSFLRTHVSTFFPTATGLPPAPEDQAALKQDLLRVQRVCAIAPRVGRSAAASGLLSAGISSATHVQSMGYAAFTAKLATTPVAGVAHAIYEKADQLASTALHAFLHTRKEMHFPAGKVLTTPGCSDPELETLFGNLDYCACKHCESVYGPAAYFVDILRFVQQRKTAGDPPVNLLDVLTARRPELIEHKLNCENAETPLPTIDLVNELLEHQVREELELEGAETNNWQTTWSASDLVAHPEHVDTDVYAAIADPEVVCYPHTLPFDLPLAEVREYLGVAGLTRVGLQDAFEWWTGVDEDQVYRIDERIGLSPGQGDIVRDVGGTPELKELWGFSALIWIPQINDVETFLEHSGLDFPRLQALLRTRLLAGVDIDYEEHCTLAGARLVDGTEDALDAALLRKLQIFFRVQRALGWSAAELDATLAALGLSLATPPVHLATLSRFVRVRRRFPQLALGEVLSWWAPLDQHIYEEGAPSYYDRVVRPRTREQAFTSFSGTLGAVRGSLLGICQLDEAGLAAAYAATGLDDDSALTLIDLSKIYRVASLARAARLSALDLVTLTFYRAVLHEGAQSPFAGHPEAPVRELLETAEAVRASGFSVVELDWVLRDRNGDRFGASDLDVMRTLIGLITALQETDADHAQSNPPGELPLRTRLEKILLGPVAPESLLAATAFVLKETDPPPADALAAQGLRAALLPFLDEDDDAYAQFGLAFGAAGTPEARVDLLDAWLRQYRREQVVIQQLATALALEPADVAVLLSSYEDSNGVALAWLTDAAFFAESSFDSEIDAAELTQETFPAQFLSRPAVATRAALYRGLRKVALVAANFRFSTGLLRWLLAHAGDVDVSILDLAHLPTESATDADVYAAYSGWDWLRRLIALRDALIAEPATLPPLLDLFFAQSFNKTAALDALVKVTGWDAAAFTALEAEDPVGQVDLKSLEAVEALRQAFRVAGRLGAAPRTALEWAKMQVDAGLSAAIRGAVQARFSAPAWLSAAQPVRDRLREAQRDALADFLVHRLPGVHDREDLFGKLLTDVDISCCGRTTRLLFATAAVQLFMQRALMGLESEDSVVLSDLDADEWSWMRRYRVWEANRKIFLYPENWLSPELRDGKSELFKRLEDEIAQTEADETSVEKAYIHYLEGLREISRLNICGMYHEFEEGAVDQMHVFGRTRGDPSKVFYRCRISGAYWTPWRELPFTIDATDVLPVVAFRRLMLIWPRVEIRSDEVDPGTLSQDSAPPPPKYRQVRLMWAELRDSEWSPIQTSEGHVRFAMGASTPANGPESAHRHWDISLTSQKGSEESLVIFPVRCAPTIFGKDVKTSTVRAKDYFVYDPRTGHFEVREADLVVETAWSLYNPYAVPPGTINWHQGFRLPDGFEPPDWIGVPPFVKFSKDLWWPTSVLVPRRGFELMYPRQEHALDARRPFVYSDASVILYFDRDVAATPEGDKNADKTSLVSYNDTSLLPYMAYTDAQVAAVQPASNAGLVATLSGGENAAVYQEWLPPEEDDVQGPLGYHVSLLYHPYVDMFLEQVRRFGTPGLLDPDVATKGTATGLLYQEKSVPLPSDYFENIHTTHEVPEADIDFLFGGAYSIYNWELFFHIPMYIADRLMAERRFAEAQKWLGYVFNPIRSPAQIEETDCRYYWRIRPFREASASMSIQEFFELLQYTGPSKALQAKKTDLKHQIAAWRHSPFNPHLIARLRPTAYMRAVVMRYLDNLIAWGDDLFREDTRESTQEAVQLYVLALQILGKRPREVDAPAHDDKSFDEAKDLDGFSNFLVEIENDVIEFNAQDHLKAFDIKAQTDFQGQHPDVFQLAYVTPADNSPLAAGDKRAPPPPPKPPFNPLPLSVGDPTEMELYFCIPPNDKLLGYWDTVADRLFKLRHCLNIEGIRRDLALFAPPIDPALLARAAAQGVDIATAISNLNAPLPHYRFLAHLGIAKEFAGQVSALGSAMLQALEKQDGEALALLRAGHEVDLLGFVRTLREKAVEEAAANVEAVREGRKLAEQRFSYYDSRQRMNALEKAEVALTTIAAVLDVVGAGLILGGSVVSVVPDGTAGISGIAATPVATISIGGSQVAKLLGMAGQSLNIIAGATRVGAGILGTQASYTRRKEEWEFQAEQATAELAQLDKQITAAELRQRLSEQELANHDKQASQSTEALEVMRSKFTNFELYQWMAGELRKSYHLAYQLAVDLSRRAERCYRYELATDSEFIQLGHWDNRRKGLLAGERLAHELRRMEAAYYENNRREYELTKRVSLANLDPVALISLRKTGACHFELPSLIFNLDHASHYLRRIKLVGVTLPAVTGPYTNVGVTLTYESGDLRTAPDGELAADPNSPVQSVAISVGQEDTGMFEPNLRDERYLPFEGKALENSRWRIELPATIRQFDYETISDVVLTIRYTAREGGSTLAVPVTAALATDLNEVIRLDANPETAGQLRIFSARAEFPEAWRSFLAAGAGNEPAELELDLSEQRFPHPQEPPGERKIKLVAFFARWPADEAKMPGGSDDVLMSPTLIPDGGSPLALGAFAVYKSGNPGSAKYDYLRLTTAAGLDDAPGTWTLQVTEGWPNGKEPEDIVLVVQHAVS
jgi:hypothetical protein